MSNAASPTPNLGNTKEPAAGSSSGTTGFNRTDAQRGLRRMGTGAGAGLAGGILVLVLPVAFLWLTSYNPGGFFTYGPTLLRTAGFFVFAGAILFAISLFVYRRSFAILRTVDRRFAAASILCIIGAVGFLLLLVSVAILVGSSTGLIQCIHGAPSHALSCLRSSQPLGAYAGLIGFWLGWLGGVGIVVGLSIAGGHFRNSTISRGAALYGILLIILVGPFVALLTSVPGIQYLLLVVPFLVVLAPGLVLGGARQVHRPA